MTSDEKCHELYKQLDVSQDTINRVQKDHNMLSKEMLDKLSELKQIKNEKLQLERKLEEIQMN
jgi:predicted  nucleic acid-binding Zn-ribbon protein